MQMPEDNRDGAKESLEAPPKLVAALKRSRTAPIFIPPTVDQAILHAARRHLSQQKRPRFKWSLLLRWGMAVAALIAVLAIVPMALRKGGSSASSGLVRGDLNHDGQVDILDAFALARELKTGGHPRPQLDINVDGVVDERDVATLAAKAVSLGKGGRS
jgi:hypothetical protein